MAEKITCPVCGAENDAGAEHCAGCGIKLSFARGLFQGEGKEEKGALLSSDTGGDEELEEMLGELLSLEEEDEEVGEDIFAEEVVVTHVPELPPEEEDELLKSLLSLGEAMEDYVECPICEERIPASATECPKCHTRFTPARPPERMEEKEISAPEATPEPTPAPPLPVEVETRAEPTVVKAAPPEEKRMTGRAGKAEIAARPKVSGRSGEPKKIEAKKAGVKKAGVEKKMPVPISGRYQDLVVASTSILLLLVFLAGGMYKPGGASG
ncbi:MAG: hypothetical protein J7L61_01485, partial [Thermoplasmata archaeon]|nr:hypothetical protein [Thermoplasmata archaeon]